MKTLIFILVLLIIYQIYLFGCSQEMFSTIINKLDFDKIKPYKLNINNQNKPIATNKNYDLYLENDVYYLQDRITKLMHSSYNYKTKISYFDYLNKILKQYPKNISSVCIFGFALGGLPLGMSSNNNIKIIDCVDIDLEMFRLFKSINPNPPKKINYYLNDVNDYIKYCERKYDVIVDDTFGLEKITVDYIKVKNMLNPNGILYINVIVAPSHIFISNLKKIFPNVYHQKANYNTLITCKLK